MQTSDNSDGYAGGFGCPSLHNGLSDGNSNCAGHGGGLGDGAGISNGVGNGDGGEVLSGACNGSGVGLGGGSSPGTGRDDCYSGAGYSDGYTYLGEDE